MPQYLLEQQRCSLFHGLACHKSEGEEPGVEGGGGKVLGLDGSGARDSLSMSLRSCYH